MGDRRFEPAYAAIADATDRVHAIQSLDDDEVIHALAAASRMQDPLIANILATEAENRMQRLRAVFTYVGDGVAALDAAGRVRWLNPAAEELLGIRKEAALGKNFHTVVEHSDRFGVLVPHEACALLLVAQTRHAAQAEGEYFVRGDRSRLCVAYTSAPTLDRNGEVSGIVVAFRNCEARQAQEAELRAARTLYRSLFNNLPLAAVSLDHKGTILDVNSCAEEQTKRSREDARGHSFRAFLRPSDVAAVERLFDEVIAGTPRTAEFDVLCGDGSFMRVRAIGVPTHNGEVEGHVRGVHCLFEPTEGVEGAPLKVFPPRQPPA